jgi:hypothetical protein
MSLSIGFLFSLPKPLVWGAQVGIPGTTLSVEMPSEMFRKAIPRNAPNIILYWGDQANSAYIQAVKQSGDRSPRQMAHDYEQQMRQVFQSFRRTGATTIERSGMKVLHRTYSAFGDGQEVVVEALFVPDPQQAVILHAICEPLRQAAMKRILFSLQAGSNEEYTDDPTSSDFSATEDQSEYHWFLEETSGLSWRTPRTWAVQKVGANPVILPPRGDVLAEHGGIKIQNLDRKIPKYNNTRKAVNDLLAFISSNHGTVLNMGEKLINGLTCHVTEFHVTLGNEYHHMWFIHVERPRTLAVIQYDVYGNQRERQRLAKLMLPHFEEGLHSLRATP